MKHFIVFGWTDSLLYTFLHYLKPQRDVCPEALIFVDFGVTMVLQSLDNGGMSVFGKTLSIYSTDVHTVISSVTAFTGNLQIKNKTILICYYLRIFTCLSSHAFKQTKHKITRLTMTRLKTRLKLKGC